MIDYLNKCLATDYHKFVQNLTQTSMFDEYLRGRIKSMGIQVLSNNGAVFQLRRRKWRKFIVSPRPPQSTSTTSSKATNNVVFKDPSRLQRRITLPRANNLKQQQPPPPPPPPQQNGSIKRRVSAL
jgi:hypothetical protein